MNDKIKSLIKSLKPLPGVYLMFDENDTIIYVGKAKSLKNRVSQYFLNNQTGKVAGMVSRVSYFETILTHNEKEAFILEMNLIKKYRPRFNIILKDGKHYPYLALKKHNEPFIKIARNTDDKNYYYFGPYPTSKDVYEVIRLLNKIFPTRKCSPKQKTPCLYYHLHECLAPCVNKIDKETLDHLYISIKDFLSGKVDDVKKNLKAKMQKASDELNFERANDLKETLKSIDALNLEQDVELSNKISRDVIGYSLREGYLSLSVLSYRRGLLLGKNSFVIEQFGELNEQIEELILQYYDSHPKPKEIILNINEIKENLESLLNVKVESKSKGTLLKIVDLAFINAKKELDAHFLSARLNDKTLDLLEELGSRLKIKTPYYLELFDNSHLQGDSPIGVSVSFLNGEPVKSMYRKYNIKYANNKDDLSMMMEVMKRRYERLLAEKRQLPDLILLDGGLNQIKVGKKVLEKLNIDIPLFGLYKNEKHQTKGVIDLLGNKYDLSDNKALFYLLVRMQDEVHRYAIGSHRYKRSVNFKKGILDDIEGLGDKRKALLLKHYQSLDELKLASVEELSQVIPSEIAKRVYQKLKAMK